MKTRKNIAGLPRNSWEATYLLLDRQREALLRQAKKRKEDEEQEKKSSSK